MTPRNFKPAKGKADDVIDIEGSETAEQPAAEPAAPSGDLDFLRQKLSKPIEEAAGAADAAEAVVAVTQPLVDKYLPTPADKSKKPAKTVEEPSRRKPMFKLAPNLTAGLDGVSRSMASEALFGDDPEIEKLFNEGIPGLPQEHPFLQAVMGVDAVPIGQNISMIGSASSCKTWLAWELGKPFVFVGGMIYLIRAEKKWDPENARAILTLVRNPDYDPFLKPGSDPDYEDLSGPNPFFVLVPELFSLKTAKQNGYINVLCSKSQDEIQSALIRDGKIIESMYGKEIGKDGKKKIVIPRFPVYYLFDSIQYVASEDQMAEVIDGKKKGFGDMHRASSFKEFLQTWANQIQYGNPFTLNVINHRKPEAEGRVEAGGFHKEAVYLMKLFLDKDTYKMNTTTGVDGTQPIVGMRPHKNSIGAEHGYEMQVKMHIWTDRKDTTGYPKRAAFLWEEAFAMMLTPLVLTKMKRSSTIPRQLGVEFKNNKFICERLGFTDKNPASPANFAVAAQRNPEFMKDFQDIFGIRRLKKYEF